MHRFGQSRATFKVHAIQSTKNHPASPHDTRKKIETATYRGFMTGA